MMLRHVGAALGALVLLTSAPAFGQTKDTLSVDLPGQPATLDPHIQWDTDSYTVYRNIFDNLVTRDPSGKIVPQIATAWKYQSDTVIDFTIRTDVKFHDGSPLTAEDVVFSVRRITDPAFKSPQLGQFNSITKAEATAPDTVRLTTSTPYPALLAQLVKLSIVPKAYVEKAGADKFNLEPMGSGPYKFKEWQKGVRVSLDANDAYWRGKPPFKSVTFQNVPDTATRMANLRTGKVDIIRQLNPDDAAQLKSEGRIKVMSIPTERVGYLFVNALATPTQDVRVRRAIAHAINRDLIIEALMPGFGKPVNVVLTPANFGFVADVKGYPFDAAKARALIKEAGAEGAEIPFITSPAYDQRVVQAVQQMLGEVGLKVTISSTDQATFLRRRQGKPRRRRVAVARPLVMRLPGCRRRHLPAVPQREHLGQVQEHRLRQGSGRGTRHARRGRPPAPLPPRLRDPARGRAGHRPLSGLRDLRRAQGAGVAADRQRSVLRVRDEVAAVGNLGLVLSLSKDEEISTPLPPCGHRARRKTAQARRSNAPA